MRRSLACLLALAAIVAGCSTPAGTPATTPSESASPTAIPLTGLVFDVPDFSGKATIRIREQLFEWPASADAVLTTDGINGAFGLRDDGTFAEGSLLRVPLITLRSDDDRRADAARETTRTGSPMRRSSRSARTHSRCRSRRPGRSPSRSTA